MFSGKTLSLTAIEGGILEICFDRRDGSVNKLDAATFDELRQALDIIDSRPETAGLLLTSGKDAFIVGADIYEFTALFREPEAAIIALSGRNGDTVTRLAALPFPIVAAINGLALGGGLELALAADHRILASDAKIGLPEISLGLIPGLGGTVRLPRLTGLATAADWIVTGRPQAAATALSTGACTQVAEPAHLRTAALDLLRRTMAEPEQWRRERQRRLGGIDGGDPAAQLAAAHAFTARSLSFVPAGGRVLAHMAASAGSDEAAALVAERELFAAIAKTQAAQALVRIFINDQAVKRKARSYRNQGTPVHRAAVLGAGIMGGGIAYTSAAHGVPVRLKDIAPAALDLGLKEAASLAAKQVATGRLRQEQADGIIAAIHPQLDDAGFDTVGIVVEAIVEKLEVKQSVLAGMEAVVRPGTVLASNTSSLPIASLGTALRRPEDLVGMHFFNPVPLMPLVEVIRSDKTSDRAAATVAAYALSMGKVPVVVKDCPGFLVNRIFTPYVLGFLRLIADGADYREIDRVAEAFGWPMGPAYLQDVIGMDTSLHVLRIISAGYPERMAHDPGHAVARMVAEGRFGQKNGLGFYRYAPDAKGRPRKELSTDTASLLAALQSQGPCDITEREIVERLMLPMVIEAAHCLEEGVAGSAAEIDMALVLGLGFPRHVGGALTYADWLGADAVLAACERHAGLGPLYQPTHGMREMAARGGRYYPD